MRKPFHQVPQITALAHLVTLGMLGIVAVPATLSTYRRINIGMSELCRPVFSSYLQNIPGSIFS